MEIDYKGQIAIMLLLKNTICENTSLVRGWGIGGTTLCPAKLLKLLCFRVHRRMNTLTRWPVKQQDCIDKSTWLYMQPLYTSGLIELIQWTAVHTKHSDTITKTYKTNGLLSLLKYVLELSQKLIGKWNKTKTTQKAMFTLATYLLSNAMRHNRPFPHSTSVRTNKSTRARLGWTFSYIYCNFVHPNLDSGPLFVGMRERSIELCNTTKLILLLLVLCNAYLKIPKDI